MRFSLASGSISQGLIAIGTGAAVIAPEQRWIGGLIILIGIMTLVFDVKLERGYLEFGSPQSLWRRLAAMVPQLMMLTGICIFIVGFFLYIQRPAQNHASENDSRKKAEELFIDCHIGSAPTAMPRSGRIFSVEILNSKSIVTTERFVLHGRDPAELLSIFNPLNTAQCIVTNYSADVLLSIDLDLVIEFAAMVKRPDGLMEGHGIENSVKSHVNIPKVDAGAELPFVFYILNQAPSFVNIHIPTTVLAQRLGAQDKAIVPVAANVASISLSPTFSGKSPK
jgi:hypothetical protein